jgi:GrpB-like predicted nucleotidyltransferase (UPF0157 family)
VPRGPELSEYDPDWPRQYLAEAERVAHALRSVLVAIEHIGSTSIPGLVGKPTVDIMVGARELDLDADIFRRMERLGYEFRGEMGVPGRRYFRKGPTYPREFNVHLVEWGGSLWHDNLLFRDYLRSHPDAAREYGALKRSTSLSSGPGSYGDRKAPFIEQVMQRARDWEAGRPPVDA